jgi:hypothetical protein
VEDHRRTIGERLQIALDAVALGKGRRERRGGILDPALLQVMQATVGDRADLSPAGVWPSFWTVRVKK